ncbi:MAG: hypothetical protein K0R57_4075 [Paenibacillaceae bacterium]|jgi:hypothetical protein|nr:hypothetical protein [Paenibacillaceae bacterium]
MTLLKKRLRSLILLVIVCSSFISYQEAPRAHAESAENAFFVAKEGADSNDGSRESPFATLERARDAIRGLKALSGLPAGGVTVYLREGVYQRTYSFELGQQDSGVEGSPIIYKAYPGEEVSIMGGFEIAGHSFSAVTDVALLERLPEEGRGHVVQANLQQLGMTDYGELVMYGHSMNYFPEGTPQVAPPELFFNGEVMTLARWPNEGYTTVQSVYEMGTVPRNYAPDVVPGKPEYVPPEERDDPWKSFTIGYEGNRPSRWVQANDPWMYGFWFYDWSDQSVQLDSVDTVNKRIKSMQPSAYGVKANQRYYVYNLLEEIDAPGEYYLDRESGMMYMYPPAPLENAVIQLSVLDTDIIHIDDAASIHFEGMYIGSSRKNAFHITDSTDIVINAATMARLGNKAVISHGGTGVKVLNSHIFDTGAGGISLNGGDRPTLTPGGNVAENNHIHDFSRIVKTYSPAIEVGGVANRVAYNLVHDGPHVGIQFSGNDHMIEYNEIFNVVTESDDMGAIYTGRNWTFRGNIIRYNFIHDIGGISGNVGVSGVYLDDAMSSAQVTGNVFYKVYRAFHVGGGRDHIIENNLLVDVTESMNLDDRAYRRSGAFASYMDPVNGTMYKSLRAMPYESQLWSARYPKLASILAGDPGIPAGNSVQRNVMVRSGSLNIASIAKEYGTVDHNLFIEEEQDPGFVDAMRMNFNLRPDSVIRELAEGFAPIPLDEIGLYTNEYRPQLPTAGGFGLVSPQSGTEGLEAHTITLSWEPSSEATRYEVVVARDPLFEDVMLNEMVQQTSIHLNGLLRGQNYYWKVKAVLGSYDEAGVWNSGGPATFRTVEAEGWHLWTPGDMLVNLWLDGADPATMTSNGDRVSEWMDKSGSSRHARQADEGRQPEYDADGKQLVFSGSQILKVPGSVFTFGGSTMYVVADVSNAASPAYLIGSSLGSPGATPGSRLYLNTVNADKAAVVAGRNDPSQQDIVQFGRPQALSIYGIQSGDAPAPYDLQVWVNGSSAGSKLQYPSTYSGTLADLYIGGRSNSVADDPSKYGGFITGTVQEVVATGAITAAERLKLEGYLAHKWGLTGRLPAEHPYKAAAPEFTNKTNLNGAIAEAEALATGAVIGSEPGQYSQAALDALVAVTGAALATAANEHAAQTAIDGATLALANAVTVFQASVNPGVGDEIPLDDILLDTSNWDYAEG